MGVSSKLVMTTNKNKDEFGILAIAEKTINNLLRAERIKNNPEALPWSVDEDNSSSVHIQVNPTSKSFTLFFQYKGEKRQLWLFTKYDSDNYDIVKKPNVQFSFNSWGNHEEILKNIQEALAKEFTTSKFYFDFNDCDDIYHAVSNGQLKERKIKTY